MLKKLTITVIYIFILAFQANAGSDGELALKKDPPKKIKDCFENLNRATFAFNQGLDEAIIKPIAKGYKNLPDPIQRDTSNAARNLSNLITIPNNILQGDVKTAIVPRSPTVVLTTNLPELIIAVLTSPCKMLLGIVIRLDKFLAALLVPF